MHDLAVLAGLQKADSDAAPVHGKRRGAGELSPEELARVSELKKIDAEVHAHELAHMAAGAGATAGGPHFQYERGPDGGLYAVGGEVPIRLSADQKDPEARLRHAETVHRAAMAPTHPSSQDVAVAAAAAMMAAQARMELAQRKGSEQQGAAAVSAPPRGGICGHNAPCGVCGPIQLTPEEARVQVSPDGSVLV